MKKIDYLFNFENKILKEALEVLKNSETSDVLYNAYKELTDKYEKLLKHSQEILKIKDENKKIVQNTQKNLKTLLDNTGQGFLSFGKDCLIEKEYSKACEFFLGENIAGKNCIDVIFKYSNEGIEEDIIKTSFEDPDKGEVYLSLLPEKLYIDKKITKCEYKLIEEKDQFKIMCIFTDITEKQELRVKLEEEKNNLKMLITVIMKQDTIKKYIRDYREYFNYRIFEEINYLESAYKILQNIYKEIHTFKGSFGQWYMNKTFDNLHKLEDEISKKMKENLSKEDLMEFIVKKDFNFLLSEDIDYIKEQLGRDLFNKEEYVWVKKKDLISLEESIKNYIEPKEYELVAQELRRLRYKSFNEIFEHFKDYLYSAAKTYGKKLETFIIETDKNLLIDEDVYYDFIKSLIHIFRNILAHGIEYPERRLYLGKSEGGNIKCEISKINKKICIEISDDGAGIDSEMLKKYAVSKGFYKKEEIDKIKEEEIFGLLFEGKFSSKLEVDKMAGRGIGLAIVKEEVEKLDGTISIKSEKGKGTKTKILLSDYDFYKSKRSFDFHILMSSLSEKLQFFLKDELKIELLRKDRKYEDVKIEFLDYSMLIDLKGKHFYNVVLSAENYSGEQIMEAFLSDCDLIVDKDFYIKSTLGEILNNIVGAVTQELEDDNKYLEMAPTVSLINIENLLKNKIDIIAQEFYLKDGKIILTLIEKIDI